MSLLKTLMEVPQTLSKASRYTAMNGVIYMASGALLFILPGVLQSIYMEPAFVGREEGLVRLIGMTLAVIGWLYFFGGRSGAKRTVAASVLDRIIFVPAVLVPLGLMGVFPNLLFSFAVLDPALGLGAWFLLQKRTEQATDRAALNGLAPPILQPCMSEGPKLQRLPSRSVPLAYRPDGERANIFSY